MWDLSDDWTCWTAAYFRDHVINLRFHFSEGSEVSLVIKSHVCVRMEQEAWWLQQKNWFSWFKVKKIRQDNFEILGSLHTVLRSRLHWQPSESCAY